MTETPSRCIAEQAEINIEEILSVIWRVRPGVHTVPCELNGFKQPDPFEGPGETYADAYSRIHARVLMLANAWRELANIASKSIERADKPNRVILPDGFVIEGRAADEWHKFMALIQELSEKVLDHSAKGGEKITVDDRVIEAEAKVAALTKALDESAKMIEGRDRNNLGVPWPGDVKMADKIRRLREAALAVTA